MLHFCVLGCTFSVSCHMGTTVFQFISLKTFYIWPGMGPSPESIFVEYFRADHERAMCPLH